MHSTMTAHSEEESLKNKPATTTATAAIVWNRAFRCVRHASTSPLKALRKARTVINQELFLVQSTYRLSVHTKILYWWSLATHQQQLTFVPAFNGKPEREKLVFSERCPSGRRSAPGKCVYAKSVSRVRIPVSPPRKGEVPEWSIGLDSKSSVLLRVPWVRIPPSPLQAQ